jgi:N-terminal acetyltransferase B complex non-catalytic subunit
LLTISPLSSASSAIANTISAFVTNTLKIYASSLSLGTSLLTTDNQYGDDAALLSVMGLVRLYTLTPSNQSLLYQSIQILETLLQKSKHNYQALLILLRIYLLVGAIGRALDIYPRLNIKQIQNDTLSHYLLTRISTLLPNDARTPTFLRDAGGIYETSRSQTPNMIQLGFERGGYGQMMGFLQFSERVSGSICRTMYQIELRRLSRMSPGYSSPGSVEEVGHKGTLWDNRDFTVVMDCELSPVGSFERSFRLGPTPGENWIRAFAAVEEIVDFLIPSSATVKEENVASNGDGNSGAEKHTLPTDVAGRIAHGLEAGNKAGEKNKEFTASEIAYLMLSGAIAELCYAAVNKDGTTVATVLEGISTLLMPATLDSLDTPDWNLLHALWMTKDSCSLIEATVRF